MKKSKKIALSIVIVVAAIVVSVCVWQWENLKALYMGIVYDDEVIETKITQSKEKLAKKLEKEGIVDKKIIEGFSKEDEKKIAKGEMTVEEAVAKLFEGDETNADKSNSATDSESQQKADSTSVNNTSESKSDSAASKPESQDKSASISTGNSGSESKGDNMPETPKQVSNSVSSKNNTGETSNVPVETSKSVESAKTESVQSSSDDKAKPLIEAAIKDMYTLKATYVQQLAAIERSAKKIYIQGEMTKERKLEIADMVMPQLVDAERACDSQVEVVLSKLKSDLSAIGADTSVVEDIREQYKSEKQLQKSKYISEYM